MIYLILHILGNAAFLLLIRLARAHPREYLLIGAVNYAVGAVIAGAMLSWASAPTLTALALGGVNGVQYQLTFVLFYALIGRSGVAVAVSLTRLAAAVPTMASIVLWREYPNSWQTVGLALAAVALPLLGGATASSSTNAASDPPAMARSPRRWWIGGAGNAAFLAGVLLIVGSGFLAAKTFAEVSTPDQRPAYIFGTYATATLLSALLWPLRGRIVSDRSATAGSHSPRGAYRFAIALGVIVGVLNVAQIEMLLRALTIVRGTIVFPLSSAVSLAMAAAGGWLFWREPLRGRAAWGVAITIAAAVFMNLR